MTIPEAFTIPQITVQLNRHEAAQLLRYFSSAHLPEHLRRVSQRFESVARLCAGERPESTETVTMLRLLLQAKDCAVRAALDGAQISTAKGLIDGTDA